VLKNIDPLLNAELLGHLAAMGHGDVLAIVDRNFPAASTARRLVTLSGVDLVTAARAIFTVFLATKGVSETPSSEVLPSPEDRSYGRGNRFA
jgi:L-fucose mutarotase/ribose pyranase (RbsD/FucU family)